MAYFTAVVVRSQAQWRARDIEIDEAETLDELVDVLRDEAGDGGTSLALVEHEDEWFALVRVDGDDDARVFVSNLDAATHSIFAAVIGAPTSAEEPEGDEDSEDDPLVEVWGGEIDLLADLGVAGSALHDLLGRYDDDPGSALTEIAEAIGIGDLLASLR